LTSDPVDSESCVVDANVFYSKYQRNVFMTLAVERLFALHWTDEIEAEWLNALEHNRPDLGAERLQRTARAMKNALPGARLSDYRRFESLLTMTDTKDRHVAAAAIRCAPCTLVTWNVRHFHGAELAALGVSINDPDGFLGRIFAADPNFACAATVRSYSFLKKRSGMPTWLEYIDILERDGLRMFAGCLREHAPTAEIESDTDALTASESDEGPADA
jgi:hypothetical protein